MPIKAHLKKVAQTVTLLMLAAPSSAVELVHQGFFTTSDGVRLHYLEAGQGEAILFIPGWLMPADIWKAQLWELSKDHHVVALDPRSQGQSDLASQGNDPLRRSRDVGELLDHLNLNAVVLVGWALGGIDALAYLRQFGTGRLTALVLVESPLAPSGENPQRSPFLQRFQNNREKAGPEYVWGLFKHPPHRDFLRELDLFVSRIPTDTALAALDNTQPGENWEVGFRTLRQVPLLYAVTPKYSTQAAYLRQEDPAARVEIFEDSGHALFFDEPERFNGLIRDFLRQASLYPAGLSYTVHPPPTAVTPTVLTPSPTPSPASPPQPAALPSPAPTAALTPLPAKTAPATPTFPPPPSFTPNNPPAAPRSIATPRPRRAVPPGSASNPIQDGFFTTSDHVKLHYLEAGRGLTLIFIPGWLLPADIWKPQLEGLAQDYHVVALDPRSQGLSDMTHQGDEPLRQGRDIQELLDHLKLNSAVLVGWSHGAFQVLAYMGEFGTDRLYAMALVDSPLAPASAAPSSDTQRARFLKRFVTDRVGATRNFVWGLFKTPPPGDFVRVLNQAAERTPTDIALALMNNVFPGDSWEPSIPTMCQIPLLYAVTPKYSFQANYLTQVDSQAQVEFFENSGHALFVDEPEHFNAVIRGFLRRASFYPAGLPERRRKPAGLTQAAPAQTPKPMK